MEWRGGGEVEGGWSGGWMEWRVDEVEGGWSGGWVRWRVDVVEGG